MALSISKDTAQQTSDLDALHISMFPANGLLETNEQIRRFELLRLAFFVLKQRKLEQRGQTNAGARLIAPSEDSPSEQKFHFSLLRHAIFQQVLTLIQLDAREQALQIIDACQK
jgi:hypothetical protein